MGFELGTGGTTPIPAEHELPGDIETRPLRLGVCYGMLPQGKIGLKLYDIDTGQVLSAVTDITINDVLMEPITVTATFLLHFEKPKE